jgi:hypothetical protein
VDTAILWADPAVENPAIDRAHRVGQRQLRCHGTLEARTAERSDDSPPKSRSADSRRTARRTVSR